VGSRGPVENLLQKDKMDALGRTRLSASAGILKKSTIKAYIEGEETLGLSISEAVNSEKPAKGVVEEKVVKLGGSISLNYGEERKRRDTF